MGNGSYSAVRAQQGLKSQDILVLLKLLASEGREWRMVDLAAELGLSQSEVSMALERAKRARLINDAKKKLLK